MTTSTRTARPARARTCPECNGPVAPSTRGKARVFCCDAHKQAHANRATVRGKALIKLAQGWRQTRGSGDLGKYLFAEMCAMLDSFNAEDLAAGRGRADDYAALVTEFNPLSEKVKASGVYGDRTFTANRYMDRKNG